MAGLSEAQYNALVIVERTCASVSMLGCTFTILTFCCSKYFSKAINRLVFYASFGNLITNIGNMMSRDFIDQPNSAGCQTQAFFIQTYVSFHLCFFFFFWMSKHRGVGGIDVILTNTHNETRAAFYQPMYYGRWPWPLMSILLFTTNSKLEICAG